MHAATRAGDKKSCNMQQTTARNATATKTTTDRRFVVFFVVLPFLMRVVHFFHSLIPDNDIGSSTSWLAEGKTAGALRLINDDNATTATPLTRQARGANDHAAESSSSSAASSSAATSFCDRSDLALRRTEMRDVICSKNGRVPEVARSNIVFLHVPKTGGESLEAALNVTKKHNLASNRMREMTTQSHDYVAVTITRNPFERMLSWYRFCLHGWRGQLPMPRRHCIAAHKLAHANHHASTAPHTAAAHSVNNDDDVELDDLDDNERQRQTTSQNGNHTIATIATAFEAWLHLVLTDPAMTTHRLGFWFTATTEAYAGGPPLLHVDYIIRFEHYESDYAVLARALGRDDHPLNNATTTTTTALLPPRNNGSSPGDSGALRLPQRGDEKKKKRRTWRGSGGVQKVKYDPILLDMLNVNDYRDIYTIRARQLVETHFARDLLLFHYAF
jgi:Sulfotransferase family